MLRSEELTAQIEPFDSFWQAPKNIEKGYSQFYKLYQHNFLKYLPRQNRRHSRDQLWPGLLCQLAR